MQGKLIRDAINAHWQTSMTTMRPVTIHNHANESSREAICKHCAAIIRISHRVPMSGEFKEKATSG
jgi:hypothetical protein